MQLSEAMQLAVTETGATPNGDGTWRYYCARSRATWDVTKNDMLDLGNKLVDTEYEGARRVRQEWDRATHARWVCHGRESE